MEIMFPGWLGVGAVLAVAGVTAWVVQVRRGMGVTSLSNLRPWGSYIAGFVYFMGLSAGCLVLAGLPLVADLPAIRPYAGLAALVALVSLVIGGLFILVDIGRPERVWRMIRHGRLGSPMMWDLLLTVAYFLIGAVLLVAILADAPASVLAVLGVVAVAAGVADGVTAFVFATQVAREFWLSAVQPMAFFAAALASAGALLQLLVLGLAPSGYVDLGLHDTEPLALVTAACLGLGLLFLLSELLTLGFSRRADALRLVRAMTASWMLWVEVVTGVVAVALYLVPATRGSTAGIVVASVLALVHLAAKRVHFVASGLAVPNLDLRGVDLDRGRGGAVLRRPVELALSTGLVGGFVVLTSLGLTVMPLGVTG
ncbi:polysulfide reductase NrfD [Cellulomonas hominis]|uniref:NrfD/PsrC family molybdoenzyme membrane anchor subunit n=1 Tax=Cellulomonas hominis TaxID=156981 RepID=UPI001C114287|nr:NrfD/PsrC family molybdoenzyme membrane anchor subunit [Cellulomonas hominis]MBU5422380.1 polysulfide reductase NrfD [Cellulomonas hominis]